MAFIDNRKFKEIREAAANGNEKAQMILQSMRKNGTQDDLNRLVDDYYGTPKVTPMALEELKVEETPVEQAPVAEVQDAVPQQIVENVEVQPDASSVPEIEDLTEILDTETDGLFDENEIKGLDFAEFLSNKRRDGLRAKKGSDYFKAYNPESRGNYLEAKKEAYRQKFGDSMHDIDASFRDYDMSIDKYSQGVSDLLDDEFEMDVGKAGEAYDDLTNNNGFMHCFGRHWDDTDTNHIVEELKGLCAKYGKKNVLAALNTLKSDNINYRDFKVNQINQEIDRYGKSLDKILK